MLELKAFLNCKVLFLQLSILADWVAFGINVGWYTRKIKVSKDTEPIKYIYQKVTYATLYYKFKGIPVRQLTLSLSQPGCSVSILNSFSFSHYSNGADFYIERLQLYNFKMTFGDFSTLSEGNQE